MSTEDQNDDIDKEIKDLIDGLGDPPEAEGTQPASPPPILVPAPKPIQVGITQVPQQTSIPTTSFGLDVLSTKYHKVFDELLGNMRDDRQQIDSQISYYATQVQGESPKQPFVEGLVSLLTTKAKVTADAMKLLDSAAKMFAASKSVSPEAKTGDTKSELDRLMSTVEFDENDP